MGARRDNSYHAWLADQDWADPDTIILGAGVRIPRWPKVEEFPEALGGLSVLELRDANAECSAHGRCAFDRSPPCGCFPVEKGGPVKALPKRPKRGKRAA